MMSIANWPESERPRERLLAQGAAALSDAELLAIFLRVGVRGQSAVDLARHLINHFGSLGNLFSASLTELLSIPGMGPAKYAQLQAVLEMARRALQAHLKENDSFSSSSEVREYLKLHLTNLKHEVFCALWLDTHHHLIAMEELFQGTLTHTSVHLREVVRRALLHNAAAVVFAHNHPSGGTNLSDEDVKTTQDLKQAMLLVEVNVLDHFIIAGRGDVVSLAELGFL